MAVPPLEVVTRNDDVDRSASQTYTFLSLQQSAHLVAALLHESESEEDALTGSPQT